MWLELALAIFAVYRLSHMIALEEGPMGLFAFIQEKTSKQSNWFERGMNCVLCLSWWIAAVPSLFLAKSGVQFILYWFGIAGAVLVLHKWINRQR